jgi:hypothetical protein
VRRDGGLIKLSVIAGDETVAELHLSEPAARHIVALLLRETG